MRAKHITIPTVLLLFLVLICTSCNTKQKQAEDEVITIVIREWVMWLIVGFLFFNGLTVGIDTLVRLKIYKLLLKKKRE